jgi:hypothetical protein
MPDFFSILIFLVIVAFNAQFGVMMFKAFFRKYIKKCCKKETDEAKELYDYEGGKDKDDMFNINEPAIKGVDIAKKIADDNDEQSSPA